MRRFSVELVDGRIAEVVRFGTPFTEGSDEVICSIEGKQFSVKVSDIKQFLGCFYFY